MIRSVEDLVLALRADPNLDPGQLAPEFAAELSDTDLEAIVGGKTGGGRRSGGGSSLNRMAQMNNVMAGFLDNQARTFRNTGINPSSSSFDRLRARGVNLSGLGMR
jgi:hypothetical protein